MPGGTHYVEVYSDATLRGSFCATFGLLFKEICLTFGTFFTKISPTLWPILFLKSNILGSLNVEKIFLPFWSTKIAITIT